MSGNDIIDIELAKKESNWKRKGFLEKIFTAKEIFLISEASLPDNLVWQLWSMKESAYKVYTRQFSGRFFAPNKIECTLLTGWNGHVIINQKKYTTISASTDKYIYSIAKPSDSEALFHSKCFYHKKYSDTKNCQSIDHKIKKTYAAITGKEIKNLHLLKNSNNLPNLFCIDDHTNIPVSITHHGNYAAFTIN